MIYCMVKMANIIDGRQIASEIKKNLGKRAEAFYRANGRKIGLAVVLVGNDPASEIYVKFKIKACEEVGVQSFVHKVGEGTSETEIVNIIKGLNCDAAVDGILVQLPLPKHIDSMRVLSNISVKKDVDGFHAENAGKLFLGAEDGIYACTPNGVLELIKSTGVDIVGKHAVVIGRSNIVGKPVSALLMSENATVTVTHSKTVNLKSHTQLADIIVSAAGVKHLVSADMVKKGAIVIDVGIIRENGKIYGDVDFENVKHFASHITPVPGGVGPMTVAMLLKNVVDTACGT